MANKRTLNTCDVYDSCVKKRKVSESISTPLPQVDGLTDENSDEKVFRFVPKVTQTSNISHSSYAPTGQANMFTNGHFAPKMSFDGKNFISPSHFNPFMPGLGIPQSLSRMSNKEDPSKNFNEISLHLMSSVPDVFKRMNTAQQGFIHPPNGSFPRMAYPNHPNASGSEQKLHMIKDELHNASISFQGVGQFSAMNGSSSYYSSFLEKRKESGLDNISFLNRPEMMTSQHPLTFGDGRNFHPTFNNGAKSFPSQFPYLNMPNIPVCSGMQDSQIHSKQFGHNLPPDNKQFFPPRACFPFPNSMHPWNPGLAGKGEFRNTEPSPDGFANNLQNALTKTGYHKNNSSVHPPGGADDPMKMIENFSASHFNSFPNVNTSLKNEDWNKTDKSDKSIQEKPSGRSEHTVKPMTQSHNEKRNQDRIAMPTTENSEKYLPHPPEKKTKRVKKNGEQVRYESWLYEKRNALRSRLATLEQEMQSIPSTASSCQELKNHFESAIAQLKKESMEHEALIRVFESAKNVFPGSKSDVPCTDKSVKPAKPNGASSHLYSSNLPQQNATQSNHPPSFQPKNRDETKPSNAHRPVVNQKIYENHPLPKIMEPSIMLSCNLNIKGWPPESDKPRLIDFKHNVNSGFKPSDALDILENLPGEGNFKVLRMEDLSRKESCQLFKTETEVDDSTDHPNQHNEFRISSEWLFLNRKYLAIESCMQCCKVLDAMPAVEEVVMEVGRQKVSHNLKYCGEQCMMTHQEKRKIWERDKQLHEEVMEEDAKKQSSKDLNGTIIYGIDANKTLPLETSKENLQHKTSPPKKKWKNIKYGTWCKLSAMMKRQKKELTEDDKKASHLPHSVHIPPGVVDVRSCFLCGGTGDDDGNGCGRLLMTDIDKWVHANCSLWSSNVYEALDGTFVGSKNFCSASCASCNRPGATIMCFLPNCGLKFHLRCAISLGVCFLENKVTYCRQHCPKNMLSSIVRDISIRRRVCVERLECQQVAKMLREDDPENFAMRLGNLVVHSIGHLLPQFIYTLKFNTTSNIYPVGYKSVRFYWSFRNLHHRCQYNCSIGESKGAPVFKIHVEEEGEDDAIFESGTCTGVWMQVLGHLDALRKSNGLSRVFTEYLSGEDLYGLNEPAVRRIIESLPGVELLHNCILKYGKSPMYIPPLAPNPSGCIRSEPKSRTLFKRSHTLLSNFNAGSSAKSTWLGSGEFSITQYMKQFTATKSQRYRSLKTEWRNNVYLRRSNIQGLGLFAGRELEQFTMVIEYIGEIIRNEIAEIREKVYEQQNRGVYMFRLDENTVIDATMTGGPARYINHCCDPNCFTEVIPTEKGNKIVIIAKRKIQSGEELSYDYKFNLEDEKSKIPCLCGAANCMKWMN